MPDTAVASLEPGWQQQFALLEEAARRRDVEAIHSVGFALLAHAPGCVEVRRRLFSPAPAMPAPSFRTRLGLLRQALRLLLPLRYPLRRVRAADRLLRVCPDHPGGWAALANAASHLDWPETTLFALESLNRLQPNEARVLRALVEARLQLGQVERAQLAAERLCDLRPRDPEAVGLLRYVCDRRADGERSGGRIISAPPPPPPPPSTSD